MLTNNYKKWVFCVLENQEDASYSIQGIRPVDGSNYNLSLYGDNSHEDRSLDKYFGAYSFSSVGGGSYSSLFVGTGQKEESEEDYVLENMIPDSDLTVVSANARFTETKFIFTKTFTYIGTNDITISEVAFYKSFAKARGKIFCLARQLIEPIPVKSGDTFTVTMVIG